jgi:hypothetical protein
MLGKRRPIIVALFADTHPNSCVGLLHKDGVYTEGGNLVLPSREQEWLWERWENYWDIIKRKKKELKARVIAVSVGDGADDNLHSKAGLLSVVNDIVIDIGVGVLEPVLPVADEIHLIAGTPAHVGDYATIEEAIAERVGGVKDKNSGRYTSFRRYIRANGVLFDCQHAPVSNSSRQHTRGGGAMRTGYEVMGEYWRREEQPPDVVVRAHVHHHEDTGENFVTRTIFCPCWKLHGQYEGKRGFVIQPVGGWYAVCLDGKADLHLELYEPERGTVHEVD